MCICIGIIMVCLNLLICCSTLTHSTDCISVVLVFTLPAKLSMTTPVVLVFHVLITHDLDIGFCIYIFDYLSVSMTVLGT